MNKRKKPADGNFYDWSRFEKWADNNSVGTIKGDWEPWWECWKAGFISAMN